MSGTVRFGYTVMTEQSGPRELVGYAVDAERAGFDFGVCSDHYSPWLTSQGHAPHAWTLLGAVAQATSCWDPSRDAAVRRAHDQFRWFGDGWAVDSDLPTPAGASQFLRPEDVAVTIACGPDLDAIVDGVRPYWEAGCTDAAIVQVGDEGQQRFQDEAATPLLDKLRAELKDSR